MTAITPSDEESLLRQMVNTIVREVSPETIILFGSRARGDARPDSDVDLLVVESEPFLPQHSSRKEVARLYMALREGGWRFPRTFSCTAGKSSITGKIS